MILKNLAAISRQSSNRIKAPLLGVCIKQAVYIEQSVYIEQAVYVEETVYI